MHSVDQIRINGHPAVVLLVASLWESEENGGSRVGQIMVRQVPGVFPMRSRPARLARLCTREPNSTAGNYYFNVNHFRNRHVMSSATTSDTCDRVYVETSHMGRRGEGHPTLGQSQAVIVR